MISGPVLKFRGIYGLEELECGCSIKHYTGGLVKFVPDISCKAVPRHTDTTIQWICPVCRMEFPSRNQLKKHKGSHAY